MRVRERAAPSSELASFWRPQQSKRDTPAGGRLEIWAHDVLNPQHRELPPEAVPLAVPLPPLLLEHNHLHAPRGVPRAHVSTLHTTRTRGARRGGGGAPSRPSRAPPRRRRPALEYVRTRARTGGAPGRPAARSRRTLAPAIVGRPTTVFSRLPTSSTCERSSVCPTTASFSLAIARTSPCAHTPTPSVRRSGRRRRRWRPAPQ